MAQRHQRLNNNARVVFHDPPPLRQDIPLRWHYGSEAELRWLTRAICHTEPDLFDSKGDVTVVYRAATDRKRGGFLCVERKGIYMRERYCTPRLTALCELAFRTNAFKGMRWVDLPGRPGDLERMAIRIRVTVSPPSAHEKAESLLTLVEWLDIRLFDTDKRARYGLPPRPER